MRAVTVPDEVREAAAAISMALPGSPVRRALDLIRVARILAVLEHETDVMADHLATAVRLCLGMNLAPQAEQPQPAEAPETAEADDQADRSRRQARTSRTPRCHNPTCRKKTC
jgi:magnesium chelatase subunit D